MPRQATPLDDLQLRRLLAAGQPVTKTDGGGLTFTLSAAGTAAWVLRYTVLGGRRRELTLGNYPDMSLAVARKLAREQRVVVDKGGDPAALKRAEKLRNAKEWTVSELDADFRTKNFSQNTDRPLSASYIYYRTWDLDNVVKPYMGALLVSEVTAAHVVDAIERANRGWTMSSRILTTINQLFHHACGRRLIAANPCAGVSLKALMGPRPKIKQRLMLTEDELTAVLPGIDELIGRENGLAFRILLATCVRSSELAKALKSDIDLDRGTWIVRADTVKTRNSFMVPLTPLVVGWFRELDALSGDSKWMLPARKQSRVARYGDTHVRHSTLGAAIRRAFERGGVPSRCFTPHDTRSTAKGHMRNMGISREISEIALNHKLRGVEGIYDVREDIPERREALARWAEFIEGCISGPRETVPTEA